VSVTEPSDAFNAGMAKQVEEDRLAQSASLRPQLFCYLFVVPRDREVFEIRCSRSSVLLHLQTETKLAVETSSHTVFSLLDFWTFEDVTNTSRNVSKELPLSAAYYLRRAQSSHNSLAMQALV
jgi:hypothetical protein